MKKQIEVSCPDCRTVLYVDVLTGKVLRSAKPSETDETGKPVLDAGRWDDAAHRVDGRSSKSVDEFDSALQRERTRASDLDELFDKAKKKAAKRDDDERESE